MPAHLENFISTVAKRGQASTKVEVARQALAYNAEKRAVQSVSRAEQEYRDGKELRGDLRTLLKQIK